MTANGLGDAVRDRTTPLRLRNDGGSPLHWRASTRRLGRAGLAPGAPRGAIRPAGKLAGARVRDGPDAGGYRWIDSDAPGGPVFQWQEIAGVGTRLFGSADDSTRTNVPLPFVP
ncbi:MAG: hypothetical protein IPJ04_13910 [Candidatus Eisenbacteria bacterium]|nr:hypothetical protein [Candidatus Eisenbacteria bacterium]